MSRTTRFAAEETLQQQEELIMTLKELEQTKAELLVAKGNDSDGQTKTGERRERR